MNKYQDALNKIVKSSWPDCIGESECSSCSIEKICNTKNWINTLQQLVDKETPKKPIKHYKSFYRCVNCEEIFQNYHYQNCCPYCGQKLDWSE